jgi:hypothetical protein
MLAKTQYGGTLTSSRPMNSIERCLDAARKCAREPFSIIKADYPTRDEFDDAIAKLADAIWLDNEPYHRAYARALNSDDGQILYWGRERAPVADPVYKSAETVRLSKAEQAIESATGRYVEKHPGISYEQALTAVLENDPELYTQYLREQK